MWLALVVFTSGLAALALASSPAAALALALLAGAALLWILLGAESVAALVLLAALGFVPFLDVESQVGPVRVWTLAFAIFGLIVLIACGVRLVASRRPVAFQGSIPLALLAALCVYTIVRLGLSNPLSVPTATAALAAFAPAALLGYVVFSQSQATASVRRVLPLLAGVFALWSLAFIAGAAGQCAPCIDFVVSDSEREGLTGAGSRLYTAGGESAPGIAVFALGALLAGATTLAFPVAVFGLLDVAFGAFRAQYAAVAAGVLLLVGWRFRRAGLNGRVVLVLATAVAVLVVVMSAVGDRALSGYQDLNQASGNAGYRLRLLDQAAESWSLFGEGVTGRSRTTGFNFDLGLPNTLHGLGYLGAALQLSVLVSALVRAVRHGGAVGVCIAAVIAVVLVGRPSLPLLEYGPSAIFYGLAVGAACALPLQKRDRDATTTSSVKAGA